MRHKLLKPYLIGCTVAAIAFLLTFLPTQRIAFEPRLVVFLVLLLLNAHYQILSVDGRRSFSITFPILFPVAAFFGPAWACALGMLGTVSLDELDRDKLVFAFNQSSIGLAAGLSTLAFQACGGIPALVLSLPVAVLTYSLVNHVLAMIVFFLRDDQPISNWTFLLNIFKTLIPSVALSAFFYYSYANYDILGLIGAYFLFVVVRSGALLGHLETNYRIALIRSLMRAVHAKDPSLMAHLENVAEYSKRLAKACRYPFWKMPILIEAAYFHDIGKLEIDDSILKKTGKLTPEEYGQMKTHPTKGIEFLQEVPLPPSHKPVVENIAGYHHERYDGTGYPRGLKGKEIPLEARIVAVADTWDAMVGQRCYRKPMPIPEAIAELRRVKGTQLDPDLVELFIQIVEEDQLNSQHARTLTQRPLQVL